MIFGLTKHVYKADRALNQRGVGRNVDHD